MPSNATKNNAITQRLDKVAALWQEFAEDKEARVCRWVLEADEVDLLMAFVKVENANEAQTADLFVRFRAFFETAEDYTKDLTAELSEEWEAYQKYFSPKGQPAAWSPSTSPKTSPKSFFDNFDSFSRQFPIFNGLAVAFLSPDEYESPAAWRQWILAALAEGIPDRVRIMLIDLKAMPVLEELTAKFPQQVRSIEPKLDMPAAIRQLAATGDPKHPGVQFRKLLVELNQQAAKGNLEEMRRLGESAISIAVRENWMYLQVATYISMANGYIGKSQTEEALSAYEKARQTAHAAWQAGDPLGPKLLSQTLLCKGSLVLGKKDYESAAKIYRDAVEPAVAAEDVIGQLEAWRMAGFCLEQHGDIQPALECNQNALAAGAQLDENLRSHSTLPYVGQALLRMAEKSGDYQGGQLVRQKMTTLCGPNWERLLATKRGGTP